MSDSPSQMTITLKYTATANKTTTKMSRACSALVQGAG